MCRDVASGASCAAAMPFAFAGPFTALKKEMLSDWASLHLRGGNSARLTEPWHTKRGIVMKRSSRQARTAIDSRHGALYDTSFSLSLGRHSQAFLISEVDHGGTEAKIIEFPHGQPSGSSRRAAAAIADLSQMQHGRPHPRCLPELRLLHGPHRCGDRGVG